MVTIIQRPYATLGFRVHTEGHDGPESPLDFWSLMMDSGEVRLPRPMTVEFLVGVLRLMLARPSAPDRLVCNAPIDLFDQCELDPMPP